MYIEEINFQDPATIYQIFSEQHGSIFLDSSLSSSDTGKYSFIAIAPFKILSSKNNKVLLEDKLKNTKQSINDNPWEILQQQLNNYNLESIPELPPFIGGAAGYFGYELNQHLENISPAKIDKLQFPDLFLGFYDLVINFDLIQKRAWLCSSGLPEKDVNKCQQRAEQRSKWLKEYIVTSSTSPIVTQKFGSNNIISNFTKTEYEQAVTKVKDYILEGDIFEANISQRFSTKLPLKLTPFNLYQRLRTVNAAPFSAFINAGNTIIASASPERFIKLTNKKVETCPIKGTRPRGNTPEKDEILKMELINSRKDHAENVMIVDLMRNDLSRVCLPNSVVVPNLCELKTFPNIHHLVSTINAELDPKNDPIDLLKATFPGGSITGAPKIRAMEIISEIEQICRGPYCGSIGYIGFDGNMDTSITIRTFSIKNNTVTFSAGGAIVLGSDPKEEYEETLTKANGLIQALYNEITI